MDVTHPKVDARDGWQYAHQFTDPDEQWTAEKSPSLERLLKDGGVVASSVQNWVRRRRWVRIMRRRIDIPPLPFLQPGGDLCFLASDGTLVPDVDQTSQDDGAEELALMAPTLFSSAQDYVARARFLAGSQTNNGDADYPSSTATEMRHSIAKLERATTELRQGILGKSFVVLGIVVRFDVPVGDEENDRKTQAEVLLNVYNRELERLRLTAGARGWSISSAGDPTSCCHKQDLTRLLDDLEGEDDSSDKFLYPGTPGEDYHSTSRASTPTVYTMSRSPIDLTPQLSQAPDFRVPTREAPQVGLSSKRSPQQSVVWERDEEVSNCRDCGRRFRLLIRKVSLFLES